MPNGYKFYTFASASDPLRADLNSYWIGDKFAKQELGNPNLMSPTYGPPTTTEDGQYLYKTRQKIKVTKNTAFDTAQSSLSLPNLPASAQNIAPLSSPSSKILPSGLQSGLVNNTFSSQKAASTNLSLTGQSAQVGSTKKPTTFPEYFENNFMDFIFATSDVANSSLDIVFQTNIPTVIKDYSTTSDPSMGKEEVKQEFLINFLQKQYEDATSIPSVTELQLPLFYETVDAMLGNDVFFNDYINPMPSENTKYENVVFPMDNYEELQDLNSYGMRYPLEVQLSPSNNTFGNPASISKALEDSSLDCYLFESLGLRASPLTKNFQMTTLKVEEPIDALEETTSNTSTSTTSLETINALNWARDLPSFTEAKRTEFAGISSNATYLGPQTLSVDMANGNVTSFQELLAQASFLGKLKDLVFKNLRSIEDINMGKKSHSEIVYYKIEKFSSFEAPTPIQTFWIPNIASESPLEYIDTQVKYNKQYYYRVFAYSAVIGTKYYYDISTLKATFNIVTPEDRAIQSEIENLEEQWNTYYELWNEVLTEYNSVLGDLRKAEKRLEDLEEENRILQQKEDNSRAFDESQGFSEDFGGGAIDHQAAIQENLDLIETLRAEIKFLEDKLAGIQASLDKFQDLMDAIRENINDLSPPPQILLNPNPRERFEIDIVTMPCVEFIENHLFDFDGSILDDPPMIPQVDFTSYIGIDNKITINMLAQVGEYKNKPVIMSTEENNYIDKLRNSRGMPPDSMITYRTDDEISGFFVYRIEAHPSSYQDFSDNIVGFASTQEMNNNVAIFSWSSSFKDTIIPNKDYYYLIRSQDIHDNLSYPSPIYKVRMVNDSGAIYPLVEVVELMMPEQPKMKRKEFKKFMQLVPKLSHKMVDYVASGMIVNDVMAPSALPFANSVELGVVEPKLFGKGNAGQTFKIRLISKKTGKKLDLNVTFKVENEDY